MTVQLGATFKAQRKLRRAKRRQRPRRARRPHYKPLVVLAWMAFVFGASLWYFSHSIVGIPRGWLAFPFVCSTSLMGGLLSGTYIEQALYLRRVRRWPQTEATVVRHWMMWNHSEEDGSRTTVYYLPVLWFRTADGTETIVISRSAPARRWPRGSEVLIHYDPEAPQNMEIASLLGWQWASALLAIVAGLGVAIGFTFGGTWAAIHWDL